MCRLLGVVSTTAQPLTALLKDDLEPFTALSSEHCDGWGVAHRDGRGGLTVRKEPGAARDSAAFQDALGEAHTDAALLHLRKASTGMVNTPDNTHPFTAGQVAFAHNGWVGDLPALDAALAEAGGPACQGGTDSERYFGLVMAAMRHVSPEVALTGVARRLNSSLPVEALNCLLLTPDALYAFTSFDHTRPTSSGHDPVASYQLGFRVTENSVVVASSGWEHSTAPWELLPNGQVLRVHRPTLHTTIHRLVPTQVPALRANSLSPSGV